MKSKVYWALRSANDMVDYMQMAEDAAEELSKYYQDASMEIQRRSAEIIRRFGRKFGLSVAEAERLLRRLKHPDDIKKLFELLKEDPKNLNLLKEYESQAYAERLRRLRVAQENVDTVMTRIANRDLIRMDELLRTVAKTAYYHSVFNIQQQTGYGFKFKSIAPDVIDGIMERKWLGVHYSDRIWNNTQAVAERVKKEIMINLLTGRSPYEAAKNIQKAFMQGSMESRRLVRTEASYVANQVHLKAFKEAGITHYQFVAVLDLKTSPPCRANDKKVFKVADAKVGTNYPPLHPWCRSTVVAYVGSKLLKKMKQNAYDPTTGKRVVVPGDMTYQQWYDKYVLRAKTVQ